MEISFRTPTPYQPARGAYGYAEQALEEDRFRRYEAHADIVLRKGAKPPDDPDAYDARSVLERLGTSIVRAEPD